MSWHEQLNSDSSGWLLEEDLDNPAIRFFALQDLLDLRGDDPEVEAAQHAVMTSGPVPVILENQHPEGWWDRSGAGYYPKYTGTVWSVTFLAQLGADGSDERVRRGCEQVLEHNRAPYGGFSFNGKNGGMVQCMQGNLCAAMIDLGWQEDERLQGALGWLVRSVTGEGIAPAEEKKAEVRRRILEAAREIFFRDGFMDANLDEIAELAGVAKGTLYRYFDNRDALVVALIAEAYDSMGETIERAVAGRICISP